MFKKMNDCFLISEISHEGAVLRSEKEDYNVEEE